MTAARCWIDRQPRPGWHNMALDAAMLDRAEATGATLIRLYRWEPHCLSFGCHEPATRRYDRDRIRARGLDCVRRPTGGRAVWHARELTYAVAAPTVGMGELAAAYVTIHEWLAAALRRLGLSVVLAARRATAPLGAGPCFASAVGGELVVGGFKVLGSAQRRGEGALLQHGSLLLEDDQAVVRELLHTDRPMPPATEAPLSRLAGRTVSFEEAAAAIRTVLADRGLALPVELVPDDVAERAPLHFDRFRSDSWTWHR